MILVVDIETTGMAPPHAEVIELGWQGIGHDGLLDPPCHGSELFGSLLPCPPEVLAVHHILDEERLLLPLFRMDDWSRSIDDLDYVAAHNADFEAAFLKYPVPWICTYKCALRIWPEAPSHGNQALMYWLGLHRSIPPSRRHPPHRAEPDAYVTARILARMLETHEASQLAAWTLEPRLLPTCPIGKQRGRPWPEVERGFLDWCLRQPDMEADIIWNVRRELTRRLRGD